jgi:LPXTG-site transpeptidase (sortase) family protein
MTCSRRQLLHAGLNGLLLSAAAPWRAIAQTAPGDSPDAVSSDDANDSTYGPAQWIRIPRIAVDSRISEVGITDGFYDVPWFDVGHHVDSHNPGETGNSIFNGHVVTVNAGEVFRHLDQLTAGDAVYVYTPAYRLDWVVDEAFSVAEDDSSFLADSDEPRVTLYTCTGRFNPIERSYAERLVVVGELVNVAPRS